MSEKYDEIIDEIRELDEATFPTSEYMSRHGIQFPPYKTENTACALDIAQRVRDAVGSDPSQWYMLDKNKKRIYIGDSVNNGYSINTVSFFSPQYGTWGVNYSEDEWDFPERVSKTDTQEQINADITMFPHEYCKKYDLFPVEENNENRESLMIKMVRHLLERQRKLDGVE